MTDQAPDFIKPKQASQSDIEKVQDFAREAISLEYEIKDMQEVLNEKTKRKTELLTKVLPDSMNEAGIDNIGIPAEGNLPGMDVKLRPFYNANIAANWPEVKRKEAFDYLESLGEGDLIKTDVTVNFGREDRQAALDFVKRLVDDDGLENVSIKEAVHFQTLTAWLKDQIENHSFIPDLGKIGGVFQTVAKLTERKDDK